MNATAIEPTTQDTKPAKKEPRSYSQSLIAADASAWLRVTAVRRRDGTATTFVVWSQKNGNKVVNTRGASSQHQDWTTARATVAKLAAEAAKLGWQPRGGRGGLKPAEDKFDVAHLPAPPRGRR